MQEPRPHREGVGQEAVHFDAPRRAPVEDHGPADVALRFEAHGQHGVPQQAPVHVVIGTLQVHEQQPQVSAPLPQVVHQPQVELYVVRDVAAIDEGRLRGADDDFQRDLQAVGQHLGHQARVNVQQGDRAVAALLVRRLAWLGDQSEEALEEVGQRGIRRHVVEGLVDRRDQQPAHRPPEVGVELDGEPILARGRVPVGCGQSGLDLRRHDAAVAVGPFSQARLRRGQASGDGVEQALPGLGVAVPGGEDALSAVR